MDLSGALREAIILEIYYEEWVQTVDYEHIPFRCRKCHEHGHLFRDFPTNNMEGNGKTTLDRDYESFTKVGHKGKGGKHPHRKISEDKHTRHNSFKILEEAGENMQIVQDIENITKEQGKEAKMEDITVNNQQKEDLPSCMEINRDHEMTPSEAGMEDHELQEILDRENLDLQKFLDQGKNIGVDSLPKEDYNRVQQHFLCRSQSKGTGVKRNHESEEPSGVKMMENSQAQSPKNSVRKRGRKRQNELLHECGKLLINSGKMKDLTSYSFTNLS